MNLAYHYPIIYWNTACLIINAGADEDSDSNKSTNYGKIATAIADMRERGITVSLPLINEAKFEFVPDEKNNRIIYSLKSLCGIGDDLAKVIVENQPYDSIDDFISKTGITPSAMIQLIKAGSFTELDNPDRRVTMAKYIRNYMFSPNDKLTTANINTAEKYGIIPDNMKIYVRIKKFKDYVLDDSFLVKKVVIANKKIPKCGYHDRYFTLDEKSTPFYMENFTDEAFVGMKDEYPIFSEKRFMKEWNSKMDVLKQWLAKPETLQTYNDAKFSELWKEKADGTIPKWEMQSLSYYYTEHELAHMDEEKYGVMNFFEMPEDPEPYDYYVRFINGEKKYMPKLNITRIAGTVIDSDNNKHTVSLLTNYGVVNVKYNKGQYVFYNRQISDYLNGSDKKTVLEKSWFTRGTLLIVCGYRQDDVFRAYRYKDTVYMHTTNKIVDINDGTVELQLDRLQTN